MPVVIIQSPGGGGVVQPDPSPQVIGTTGIPGPAGPPGPRGPQGPAGPSGTEGTGVSLVFPFDMPTTEVLCTHNLNAYPSVTVVDSAGTVVIGEVQYIDANTLVVRFLAPFSGKLYLN